MVLVPKFSSDDWNIQSAPVQIVGPKVEIQLMDRAWSELLHDCQGLIDRIHHVGLLEEVVLHLPLGRHTFVSYLRNRDCMELWSFVYEMWKFIKPRNLRLGFLFHADDSVFECSTKPTVNVLRELSRYMSGLSRKMYILVENTCDHYADSFSELLRLCPEPNVFGCLDVTHARAVENILQTPYRLDLDVSNRISWVHFAAALNGDGFRDKKTTHGRVHPDVDAVLEDLRFLKDNGVDIHTVPIVAEISESDYVLRPDMVTELDLLTKAFHQLGA